MERNHPLRRLARATHALGSLSVIALAAACGTQGAFVPVGEYPQAAPETDYRIAPGDAIGIRVWNQDSMSTPLARVREDGKISVPFLQDVVAAGATPVELSERLQTKLKAFVVNPVVTVTVEQVRPLRISVVGEVARPGLYDLERGAGVLAAIAAAGGLTDYAGRDSIFVMRDSPDGKGPARIRFRYAALTGGERRAATFRLRPGDVVLVD